LVVLPYYVRDAHSVGKAQSEDAAVLDGLRHAITKPS
jgi:hypothetical protein